VRRRSGHGRISFLDPRISAFCQACSLRHHPDREVPFTPSHRQIVAEFGQRPSHTRRQNIIYSRSHVNHYISILMHSKHSFMSAYYSKGSLLRMISKCTSTTCAIDHKRVVYRHQGRDFRLTDVSGQVADGIIA
jgi:hypothetical protein